MAETFKLLTYNIHRGLSAVKKRDILKQILMILELSGADIVCLQEVWQDVGLNEHQLEALCEAGWRHRLYGANAIFPGGATGNAILSRFEVNQWNHVDISVSGHESRGFLHVELIAGSGVPLNVICAHFGLRNSERRMQSLWLQQFIAKRIGPDLPLVLAGDFNDWRGRPESIIAAEHQFHEAMTETVGRFGKTFPSFFPVLPLDRIYYRNLDLQEAQIIRRLEPAASLSDHLPVEAVFALGQGVQVGGENEHGEAKGGGAEATTSGATSRDGTKPSAPPPRDRR